MIISGDGVSSFIRGNMVLIFSIILLGLVVWYMFKHYEDYVNTMENYRR